MIVKQWVNGGAYSGVETLDGRKNLAETYTSGLPLHREHWEVDGLPDQSYGSLWEYRVCFGFVDQSTLSCSKGKGARCACYCDSSR